MEILGHGIDIVDLRKFRILIDDPEKDFVRNCFTKIEQADAGESHKQIERLAGRFATKEAVLKALGIGWGNGISWTDVETQNLPSGAPRIILYGRVVVIAEELGIARWLVSTSHSETSAVASAIAIGDLA